MCKNCAFEVKVLLGLEKCGIKFSKKKSLRIGVAVSGGADSVSLLLSLVNLKKEFNFSLYVISVNHNIRLKEESGGDVDFVEKLCSTLNTAIKKCSDDGGVSENLIHFTKAEIPVGKVQECAKKREQGIEDAARTLRYEIFEQFISDKKIDFLCLAHNQNDQTETLLMRFLQGAGIESSGGIKQVREKYIRPLLEIERSEIEEYLTRKKIAWRTDSTNFDTSYLRNKIRQKLIPFLDTEFVGWKTAVLNGGKKAQENSDFLNDVVERFEFEFSFGDMNDEDEFESLQVSIPLRKFEKLPTAVKLPILTKSCNMVGENKRIPYVFLQDVLACVEQTTNHTSSSVAKKSFTKYFDQICITRKKNYLFIKKAEKIHTDLSFFDIIEESGKYLFPFGELEVLQVEQDECSVQNSAQELQQNKSILVNGIEIKNISFPFIVRNVQLDDEIESAKSTELLECSFKKIADIFSDWHVEQRHKELIPVIQLILENGQPIKAILGSFFGYKDWVVK